MSKRNIDVMGEEMKEVRSTRLKKVRGDRVNNASG